jgi:hypothetical protein
MNKNENENGEKNIEEVYYHYCSIESFMSIIESKSIWLTNAKFMNDRLENKMIEENFDYIIEILKPLKTEIFIDNLIENFKQYKNEVYLFCLSKNPDKLSQWRGYADDGKGVAIGFSMRRGAQVSYIVPRFGESDVQLGIHEVIYERDKQKEIILRKCDEDDRNKNDSSVTLSLDFVDFSMIFKHDSFDEEEEARLMYVRCDEIKDKPENISDLKFRNSKNKIVDYFEFHFDTKENQLFDSILIPEIYLGPKCEMKREEVEMFLKHHDLSGTKVIKSESSYY